jgi:hypothetical protein
MEQCVALIEMYEGVRCLIMQVLLNQIAVEVLWSLCLPFTFHCGTPFIPAKSYACMSMSWSPGNILGQLSHARTEREFPTR